MKLKTFISENLAYILLSLAVLAGIGSFFTSLSGFDTEDVAHHVSMRLSRRMQRLDAYSAEVLNAPASADHWEELKGLPDDMVIYRYECDTLHSWYNIFSVNNDDISTKALYQRISDPRVSLTSPLSSASEEPSFMNMGSKWYIIKMYEEGDSKVISGLLVKNIQEEDIQKGRNGISDHIHIHGRYDVSTLSDGEGSTVYLEGVPVFKVVVAPGMSSDPGILSSYGFRWVAMLLLIAALMVFLNGHRRPRYCLAVVLTFLVMALIARWWGMQLMEYVQFFSPTLYAHDGLLNSFGNLLFFNASMFLTAWSVFMCRSSISEWACRSDRRRTLSLAVGMTVPPLQLLYIIYTFSSLIKNSSVTVELYRVSSLSVYSAVTYVTYIFLAVSVLLVMESLVAVYNRWRGTSFSFLTIRGLLLFSVAVSLTVGSVSTYMGFSKEQARVQGLSNRLAVDRDLAMEIELRGMENDIATDPMIAALTHVDGGEQMLLRRLDEMYLGRFGQRFDINVDIIREMDANFSHQLDAMLSDASPIGPKSHFYYSYDGTDGSRYTGFFSYYSPVYGMSGILIRALPRLVRHDRGYSYVTGSSGRGPSFPPIYSYARYSGNRLVQFQGNYAYPTVMDYILYGERGNRDTFVRDGYRHFVTRISDDETIVVTRRERGMLNYFVTFTFLVILTFLCSLLFRHRSREVSEGSNFFSTRMRRLVVLSLFIALVVMTAVSVVFVNQRNERNLETMMSARISSIQIMLGNVCRQLTEPAQMMDASFASDLESVSETTDSDLVLYTPDGRLFMTSSPEIRDRQLTSFRMDPDAYKAIHFGHQRYYIKKIGSFRRSYHMLYAPVMNSMGHTVAIASTIYVQRDYDFSRDAFFHAATIISFFLILLFVAVVLSTSITRSIFQPLLAMRQKMVGADPSSLEQIDYQGNDEITLLVGAYNKMVSDLKDSTAALAAAERDKAWSEMARQVAHEIKNPLTPIKLEIQRLVRLKQRNDPSWEDKFDRVSAVVLEHIDILTQTANEFSTFAKLYSENPVVFDLDATLKDQIMLFGTRDNVEITYLGTEGAMVKGPKPQLIRVFVNLLTNAVQAVETMDRGLITVTLRRGVAAGTWDITFEDNGPGVSEENMDKLFTPNFTTKSSGTGLGLAICRSIVDKCEGRIAYTRSFSLGGACFTVTLKDVEGEDL